MENNYFLSPLYCKLHVNQMFQRNPLYVKSILNNQSHLFIQFRCDVKLVLTHFSVYSKMPFKKIDEQL